MREKAGKYLTAHNRKLAKIWAIDPDPAAELSRDDAQFVEALVMDPAWLDQLQERKVGAHLIVCVGSVKDIYTYAVDAVCTVDCYPAYFCFTIVDAKKAKCEGSPVILLSGEPERTAPRLESTKGAIEIFSVRSTYTA